MTTITRRGGGSKGNTAEAGMKPEEVKRLVDECLKKATGPLEQRILDLEMKLEEAKKLIHEASLQPASTIAPGHVKAKGIYQTLEAAFKHQKSMQEFAEW